MSTRRHWPSADDVRPRGRGLRSGRAPPFERRRRGEGLEVEKHPNADKLKSASVDVGTGEVLQIVCGAPNVVAGMKVPLRAASGAKLPGAVIRRSPRGDARRRASGMLCSARELGFSEDHERPARAAGRCDRSARPARRAGLDDQLFTVKLTPNRADCLSVTGDRARGRGDHRRR
jgi:phenylalanyl-tRNA synthetase beta chain